MVSRLLLLSVVAAVTAGPVAAETIVVTAPPSFRDLNYRGADVEAARTAFAGAIPQGSSATVARKLLIEAGARCADASQARLRCTSNGFDVVENKLHDLSWTVAVEHDGDTVTGLSVDRQSIGS